VLALPALGTAVPATTLALLVAGGVVYTGGAVVLATRVPDPFPRVFGYHEVWHAMVVVAVGLHYVAIHGVVSG
jgi:hemolysin III